ncbi:phenylacetic acid degradation operon negative regulatory protein [Catenuloplanes nepalensis]|uniref:Phenylacetic acid degradation operon negative regulatory protein n=1 Tax=Catenuloplanes nepalensis TaxID=587533 RepID=A0ABT9MLR7_9ACTN|nr:PaaX family transcriptional regulator C-terminal domain-containing protein [Catenuloplanes nepalensis]MDP9792368.1 phenylacetic acid degradation operon negative regulatory protein [Catenuloplanes nepalensis]
MPPDPTDHPPRPQTLLLMLLGDFVLDRDVCVFSGSVIDALARLGVSEHATRSTLSRMAGRDLLRRQRHGRKVYYGLTPRSTAILRDGRTRIWETGAVNDRWDGSWTLLCFSLPEAWQRQRHDLRSQLTWSGFGPLQGGLWIAPGEVNAGDIVTGLGLEAHARVFRARADDLTDLAAMIADAYDLNEVAARYRSFLDRWEAAPPAADPLAARLRLIAEWLGAIRRDPRLPVEHLPSGWPAAGAQKLFRDLELAYAAPARTAATTLLDLRACPGGSVVDGSSR